MALTIIHGVVSYVVDGISYHKSFRASGESKIPHGKIRIVQKSAGRDRQSITVVLIPERHRSLNMRSCMLEGRVDISADSVLVNGFQSWTESREFRKGESRKPMTPLGNPWIHKYSLKTYGDQHFVEYSGAPGVFHSHTVTYVRHDAADITLLGSLSEALGYTIFSIRFPKDRAEPNMTITRECEGLNVTEPVEICSLIVLTGPEQEVFREWGREFIGSPLQKETASGWTSWYNYYEHISEKIIRDNTEAFASRGIPIDYIQIDDGWQQAVGDWLSVKDTFPSGMQAIADEIKEAGYTPGLWLAPFVAEESSELCREHAEWIVRDADGRLVRAGYNPSNWSGNFYSLNIDLPDVRDYLRKVFTVIRDEWGFGLVKLDFLYAAAIVPRGGKSRGQIMHEGMALLRELAGSMKILGCGVPLGSAAGKVEYCRIGSDVSLRWEDLRLKMIRYRERVSTVNSLTSTIGRRGLNKVLFVNDPDVFILRSENTSLNAEQKRTLLLANNLYGGLVFTSDDISMYTPAEMQLYLSAFPLLDKQLLRTSQNHALTLTEFSIKERRYVLLTNLGSSAVKGALPGSREDLWFESTYERDSIQLHPGGETVHIPPYGSRCLVLCEQRPWGVLGTSHRLFPASEIHSFHAVVEHDDTVNLYVQIEQGVPELGSVYVMIPEAHREHADRIYLHGERVELIRSGGMLIARADMDGTV